MNIISSFLYLVFTDLVYRQDCFVCATLSFQPLLSALECADGSPFGIYVDQDPKVPLEESTNHVIVLMGGSSCTSPEDCLKDFNERPFVFSTAYNPSSIEGTTILSDDPDVNPSMHSYTKWLVPYCSQDFFLSSTGKVGEFTHSGSEMFRHAISHWRGQVIEAHGGVRRTNSLDNVVVVGISAGAVGLMNHMPAVRAAVNDVGASNLLVMLDAPTVLSDSGYVEKDFNQAMDYYVDFEEFPLCDPSHPFSRQYHDVSTLPCCLSTHCLLRHDREGLASFALEDSEAATRSQATEKLLILDSAYDPVALLGGTFFLQDGNEEHSTRESIDGMWTMVETAGNQKTRAKETAAALRAVENGGTGRVQTRLHWIITSCVSHSYLAPAVDFLLLACKHADYSIDGFDVVCNSDGQANQYTSDLNLKLRIWRTLNTWNQVNFQGQSIHELVQDFVGGFQPAKETMGIIDLRMEGCSGPNCLDPDQADWERPSCQSLIEIENDFVPVPKAFQISWLVFIACLLLSSFLMRGNRSTAPTSQGSLSTSRQSSPCTMETLVSLHGIHVKTKDSKKSLLHTVDLDLHKGAILGICGRSGSGKTTLLRVLSQNAQPNYSVSIDQGKSQLEGVSSSYLCQEDSLLGFGNMLPMEFLLITAKIYATQDAKVQDLFEFTKDLFARTDVGSVDQSVEPASTQFNPFLETKIANLSGGQRRILSIAATLLCEPQLVLLDEPLGQLDSISSLQVMSALKCLAARQNCSVVLSVHHASKEILAHLDGVIVLDNGNIARNERVSDPESMARRITRALARRKQSESKSSIDQGSERSLSTSPGTSEALYAEPLPECQSAMPSYKGLGSVGVDDLVQCKESSRAISGSLSCIRSITRVGPLVQRIHRQSGGYDFTEGSTIILALIIVAGVLTVDDGSHLQAVVASASMIAVPTFLFTYKIFAYNQLWLSHKYEMEDKRISPLSFQVATLLFTFPIPMMALCIALAIAYCILGWPFTTFAVQFLFAGVHMMVALQFGRVLSVLCKGDFGRVTKVYTTVVLLSGVFSGVFVTTVKFPDSLQFLFKLSMNFWALSGAVLNIFDGANGHFENDHCYDFFSCLLSDGNVAGRVLGFSPISNSYLALGVLTAVLTSLVLVEYGLLLFRCQGTLARRSSTGNKRMGCAGTGIEEETGESDSELEV